MKMKEIGPRGGARPWRPLDSANAITLLIPNPELRLVIINFAKPQTFNTGPLLTAGKSNYCKYTSR